MQAEAPDRVGRRLAAILAADVVGYSRLMEADEAGTARVLREHRTAADPLVVEHGGRIVKTTGDGVLIEFPSVVAAVQCAVALQKVMAECNAGVPRERRMDWRVGIHLGDILIDGEDILGDGVNLAARLEGIAEPGGICISEDAFRQVRGKIETEFLDGGEQTLKNLARPVRIYRAQPASAPVSSVPSATALPLPDKPSIAVLPFRNMSGDPEQEYFVDGMVEEIITALSRIRWLFVIARNSSFTYKGQAVDVKRVGRDLGVRYVLEGSVRKAAGRVRITAQLIDALTGTHLWADRFDRALDDVFALQDELTISVVGAIEPSLRKAEIERARRKRPDSLDAYDLCLRALPLVSTAMPEDADKALPLLEEAIRLEPDYPAAHAALAWCHEQRYLRGGLDEGTREAARRHARAALAAGGDDAMALATAGFVIAVVERDYTTAIDANDRALTLSPSSALAFALGSIIRAWRGDLPTAIAHGETALRLSPYDPLIYLPYVGLAYAHFFAGHFAEAASAASRAMQANPRFSVPCYLYTAALACLGRHEEAGVSAQHLLELQPGFTIASLVAGTSIAAADRLSRLAEALRRAELPEE